MNADSNTGAIKIAEILESTANSFGLSFTKIRDTVFYFKNERVSFSVFNNNWPHNSSSGYLLAWNKYASHKVLEINNIPSVDQIFIQRTDELPFDKAKAFFIQNNGEVVLKDNFGVNGRSIIFCNNDFADFQKKLIFFFSRYGGVNISRKIVIANEYRCIVLCGKTELIYQKNRPKIIGDGTSTIISLLLNTQYKILKLKSEIESKLYSVPEKGEVIELSEQDNLSLGATPSILQKDNNLFHELENLAEKSATALDLNFCAIDILLEKSGKLRVMEANSGIMFTNFVTADEKNEKEVRRIFNRAIELLIK